MEKNFEDILHFYKKENRLISISPDYCEILGSDKIEDTNKLFGEKFTEYRKKWLDHPKNYFVGDFPLHLDVEVTNTCNLRCRMCQIPFSKMEKGFMDIENYKEILNEVKKYNLPSMKFNFRGEPLLHPKISEFVRLAKESGVLEAQFNTNGVLLDKKPSKELIDAELDRIKFSVDSINPQTYNKIRKGADYEKTVNNIIEFVEIRNKMNKKFPSVQIQMVVMRTNISEIKDYIKFWENIVNRIGFSRYRSKYNLLGDKEKVGEMKMRIPCPQLWQRLLITWDGVILMCCGDHQLKSPIGNIKDDRLSEVWNSKRLNKIRQLHREGKFDEISACKECEVNYR